MLIKISSIPDIIDRFGKRFWKTLSNEEAEILTRTFRFVIRYTIFAYRIENIWFVAKLAIERK